MGKPTERQVALLTKWGITVPPTEQAAKSLVSFVFRFRGNYTIGENEFARREIVKKAQSEWIGKRARAYSRDTGVVLYLKAKWQDQVVGQREMHREIYKTDMRVVRPFRARFKPDSGGQSTDVSLGDLELLDDETNAA